MYRKTLVDGLFGDNGLASIETNVIAIGVMSSKFLNQCFAYALDDNKSYVSKCITDLLWLNITASRPRWTNNKCEAINHVLKQSIQWQPKLLFAADRPIADAFLTYTVVKCWLEEQRVQLS